LAASAAGAHRPRARGRRTSHASAHIAVTNEASRARPLRARRWPSASPA
jgi:hypothetical protein